MKKFNISLRVLPRKGLANPQNETVTSTLKRMGFTAIDSISVGRWIELSVNAENEPHARELAIEACAKILINPIMEDVSIEVLSQ